MITYRATLDVPAETAYQVARWLTAHRRAHDVRPWQRVAPPFTQAVMVLRWFKEATDMRILARDARVSIATGYRYLHEAIDVIAEQSPDLPDVLTDGLHRGWGFVYLDGTLIPCTRTSAPSAAGHDLWYSGKHKRHGGNIQVLTGPTGYPEWVSDVEPGSTHDITTARTHALPALYPAATQGLTTLTDKGYAGAGIGIQVPLKGRNLAPGNQTRNTIITHSAHPPNAPTPSSNAPGKHSNASPSTPGESAQSPPPPSYYTTFNDQPGEKTSVLPEVSITTMLRWLAPAETCLSTGWSTVDGATGRNCTASARVRVLVKTLERRDEKPST